MIPLSLTLKGIYSYQDKEQIVDFQQLSSAGLFGIFGPVGSGKSTILEAISYALYGETERLNRRENRGYNMMNLKSDNLLIDFIFKNGTDNQEYRFIVKGRRNTKRFDDVKAFERQAFKKEKNDWLPISADSAEEITGLNYINFRRTIIIPQGRFQEFLQLGDTDRTRMMKELFQLDRFDLYDKTRALENKNQNKIISVEGQLLQLNEVSVAKIEAIKNQTVELKKLLFENQKQLKEKESKVAELKSLAELFEKISLYEQELEMLNIQKPEIEQLKAGVKEYQYCLLNFKNKIDKLDADKNKQKVLEAELSTAQNQLEQLVVELNKLELEFNDLKIRYSQKEALKNEALAYGKVLNIKKIRADIQLLEERADNGTKILENTDGLINDLEKEREKFKIEIQQLRDNQPDMAELAHIKTWYTELNALNKESKSHTLQAEDLLVRKKVTQQEILQVMNDAGLAIKDIDNEAIQSFFKKINEEFDAEREGYEHELKHLNVKQGLVQYSENLKEGEACPVCGSTHHPEKMEATDLSEKIKTLGEKLNTLKSLQKSLGDKDKLMSSKLVEYQSIEMQLNEKTAKVSELNQHIDQHNNSYQFAKKLNENEVAEAFSQAEKSVAMLRNLEKELTQIENQLTGELKNREKYQVALHQIGNDLASKRAGCETLLEQLDFEDNEEVLQLTDNELNIRIKNLELAYNKLVNDYELADKKLAEAKPQRDKLQGMIESKTSDLVQLLEEIQNQQQVIDKEVLTSKYQALDEIRAILEEGYDIEKENEKINHFENKLFSISEQLKTLRQSAENKIFDPDEYKQVEADLEAGRNALDGMNKQLGSLEKDRLEQEKKLVAKEQLQKEYEQLSMRAENIKILKNLFKGSGFVNYVSSVYLQNLINAANVRFAELTGQKLRLELTDTNDFIIRDYLNEGKTRSVKTLSGGQTFQASLSLALALADNIQSVTKSENNFFFLDEGFGSLDKESLSVVFQSLKSLRKENRVVGIISHVEELQQEIDSYLKIENDVELGSQVSRSWE